MLMVIVSFGQEFYNQCEEELKELKVKDLEREKRIEELELLVSNWVTTNKISFKLRESDKVLNMPQPFVIRFMRDNKIMISLKSIVGEVRIFEEKILDNVKD